MLSAELYFYSVLLVLLDCPLVVFMAYQIVICIEKQKRVQVQPVLTPDKLVVVFLTG